MSSDGEDGSPAPVDEFVDIPDEDGQVQSWKVIRRPAVLGENFDIRQAMELDSDDSDADETHGDARDRREGNTVKKAVFRSIWQNVRYAMNASQPGALSRGLYWSEIPSNVRVLVHQTVLEQEPYLKRFHGGWITEEIAKKQLRNKRDTLTRAKKRTAGKRTAKPMRLIAQTARDKSKRSVGRDRTSNTSKARKAAPVGAKHTVRTNATADNARVQEERQNTSEPNTDGEEPNTNDVPASKPPPKKKRRKTSKPSEQPQPSTSTQNPPLNPNDDDDDNWGDQVAAELTHLPAAEVNQDANMPPAAKKNKPRPKMRPPPGPDSDNEENTLAPTTKAKLPATSKKPARGAKKAEPIKASRNGRVTRIPAGGKSLNKGKGRAV